MAQKRDKLELLQADRITSFARDGLTYRRVIGNVKFRRNDAVLSCEMAEFQVEKDLALLQGNVSIVTETSTLTGRRARYDGQREYLELTGETHFDDPPYRVNAETMGYYIKEKKVIASGNPVLIDSASTLRADSIYYFEESKLGDARGKAHMVNEADSLSVAGDHLLYFSGRDSLLSFGNASFKKWSTTDTSLNISSDSLSLEEGFFFAWKNVRLRNGDAEGRCGQAVYMQDDDVAVMKENPVLYQSDFVLRGSLFNLHMDNGELSSIYVPEDPHFTQNKHLGDSTYQDWLDGKVMAVEFVDGDPYSVTLMNMATSFFNVLEDSSFKGSNKVSGDTLFIKLKDSEIADIKVSGGAEGVFEPASGSRDIGFPINYKADLIAYNMGDETTELEQNASIVYGDMTLKAGKVGVFWRRNLLKAESLIDTSGAADFPVLKQTGQDDFLGKVMVYDLKTRRGKVTAGRTTMEDGNYYGEALTRINEEVYLMEDGYYTTCSIEEHPHFYFYSRQMKLLTDRLIIARPVVLYIAEIPLVALPFAVFPQKKGRRSGFILPSYDYRPNNGGRALKGFGYYWAMSEYSDFKMTGDFYDAYEEFKLRSVVRYKKRYRIDGRIDASIASERNALDDPQTWRWKLKFTHNQTIDPTFTIRAEGELSGDANFDRNYSHDQDERLNTKLHSGISISKKLEALDATSSLSGTYDENLQVTRRVEEMPGSAGLTLNGPKLALPSFNFNRSSAPIFPTEGSDSKWYNTFRWSYNNALRNTRSWTYYSRMNPDTLNGDSLFWEEEIKDTRTWNHNLGISGNTQLLKVLKITASINYRDAWGFRYLDPVLDNSGRAYIDTGNGAIMTQEVDGFIRRGTFGTSASMNTKLYGIFPVRLGPLQAIRHTLTPSVSLNYAPDFSGTAWGYMVELEDTSGTLRSFDRFAGSDLGATPSRESLSMSYSVDNVFDYKLFRNDKETKGQFFTWKLSGSYNFKADSLKASDLRNTFKIDLGDNFKLSPQATFEIYERDSTGTRKINQFRSPRLTKASFTFGFRLQGGAPGGLSRTVSAELPADSLAGMSDEEALLRKDLSSVGKKPGKGRTAWTASFNFSYDYAHDNPLDESKQTFNMGTNLKFNLSENWSVTYNPRFNLIDRKVLPATIGVSRDLHCWQMTLSWTPMGRWGGLNLLIRPKAPQLQDLKFEHTANRKY